LGYRFLFTAWFDRDLKSLDKHNPDLRGELEAFLDTFDAQSHPVIPNTGGARKARMRAKAKGKRGGYRVIYYYLTDDNEVWLITIYDKVQKEGFSPFEALRIKQLIQNIQKNRSK
jgi:mRNA-degrading endonuclease RelE of RelBE toxin-antitoxin system